MSDKYTHTSKLIKLLLSKIRNINHRYTTLLNDPISGTYMLHKLIHRNSELDISLELSSIDQRNDLPFIRVRTTRLVRILPGFTRGCLANFENFPRCMGNFEIHLTRNFARRISVEFLARTHPFVESFPVARWISVNILL